MQQLLERVAIDRVNLVHGFALVRGTPRLTSPGYLLLASEQALDPSDVLHLGHDQETRAHRLVLLPLFSVALLVLDFSADILDFERSSPHLLLHGRLLSTAIVVGYQMYFGALLRCLFRRDS